MRQTPRVSLTIQCTALAKRRLGRSELGKRSRIGTTVGPRPRSTSILDCQATNKIVGISDEAAKFLSTFFYAPRRTRPSIPVGAALRCYGDDIEVLKPARSASSFGCAPESQPFAGRAKAYTHSFRAFATLRMEASLLKATPLIRCVDGPACGSCFRRRSATTPIRGRARRQPGSSRRSRR